MSKVTRKLFSERDDANLKKLVKRYGEDWEMISDKIKKFSPRQCKDRYTVYLSGEFRNDPWTEEEDLKLAELYREFGPRWCEICKFFDGRHSNSVKNRWHRYIKPKEIDYSDIEEGLTSPEALSPKESKVEKKEKTPIKEQKKPTSEIVEYDTAFNDLFVDFDDNFLGSQDFSAFFM